jgi:hypothetical protein
MRHLPLCYFDDIPAVAMQDIMDGMIQSSHEPELWECELSFDEVPEPVSDAEALFQIAA